MVGRGCEGAAAVFAFWPTLTYFCDSDTLLYDRSEIIHISTAIRTTVIPPSKRTHFELLLASSPTNDLHLVKVCESGLT